MTVESTLVIPNSIDPQRILQQLAQELSVSYRQVEATVGLLDEGATVPFIARYRKEITGGLDDTRLRELEVRLAYIRELEERRLAILHSIAEQDKLTPELAKEIQTATTKQRLEDLYTPFKPKRRTRAQIAREAGLSSLVSAILTQSTQDPLQLAEKFINAEAGFEDARSALNGARDILSEEWAEQADLLSHLRELFWKQGYLYSSLVKDQEEKGQNFQDWFDYHESLSKLPSHRILAMLRGRQQGILNLKIALDNDNETATPHPYIKEIAHFLTIPVRFDAQASAQQMWLADVCRWTWRVRLQPLFETEFLTRLRDEAEQEAINVFASNLKDLLLAAPAGPRSVLGLDPGIRTGVKLAAIDSTGKVVETATIYPFEPRRDRSGSIKTLARMIHQHQISLVAIGNGTASRETEKLVAEVQAEHKQLTFDRIVVSEAGASVYSASELASKEFPDMDVSLRGAVSIARRLQDPLAELVKIEPKAIGVGQYQHDVNQRELARSLDVVIEDCVNAVGVDVNTASAALLSRVSGLSSNVANNIVQWRNENGAFPSRNYLLKVPRLGPKAFEQAAGFLRIQNGDNPLDRSAVHPEAYPLVERILKKISCTANDIIGNNQALKGIKASEFTDEQFGLPTIQDIFKELEKPGRDPRPEFKTAKFTEGIHSLKDLYPGLVLEGVVTNVANFGAFVDIGVHQDGLVHISALADKFIKDPRDIVRVGQTVTVSVVEVDEKRQRIALSMRSGDTTETGKPPVSQPRNQKSRQKPPAPSNDNAMAQAFAKLRQK